MQLRRDDQRREQKGYCAEERLLNLPKLGAENGSDLAGSAAPSRPFARVEGLETKLHTMGGMAMAADVKLNTRCARIRARE